MAVNDVLAVTHVCRVPANTAEGAVNTVHYLITSETLLGCTDVEIATALRTEYSALYAPAMSNQATYDHAECRRIFPVPPTAVGISVGAAVVGTVNDDVLPFAVCGLITKFTAFGGVKYRGRMYIPYGPESANTATGNPEAAQVALLAAIGVAYAGTETIVGLNGTVTMIPVIVHRMAGVFAGTTPVLRCQARLRWGTQRRRNNQRF